MANTMKPHAEIVDDTFKGNMQALNASQEENAVGYKEYVEARDLDISDQEVSRLSACVNHTDIQCQIQMKRLRWKLDLVILPMFLITQALQFMDKTSLNYANLFGYQKALGLKGQQFGYLSASKSLLLRHPSSGRSTHGLN